MARFTEKIKEVAARIEGDPQTDSINLQPVGTKDNLLSSFDDIDDIFQAFPGDETYDEELDALIYDDMDFSVDDPLVEDWQAEDDFEFAGKI